MNNNSFKELVRLLTGTSIKSENISELKELLFEDEPEINIDFENKSINIKFNK